MKHTLYPIYNKTDKLTVENTLFKMFINNFKIRSRDEFSQYLTWYSCEKATMFNNIDEVKDFHTKVVDHLKLYIESFNTDNFLNINNIFNDIKIKIDLYPFYKKYIDLRISTHGITISSNVFIDTLKELIKYKTSSIALYDDTLYTNFRVDNSTLIIDEKNVTNYYPKPFTILDVKNWINKQSIVDKLLNTSNNNVVKVYTLDKETNTVFCNSEPFKSYEEYLNDYINEREYLLQNPEQGFISIIEVQTLKHMTIEQRKEYYTKTINRQLDQPFIILPPYITKIGSQ